LFLRNIYNTVIVISFLCFLKTDINPSLEVDQSRHFLKGAFISVVKHRRPYCTHFSYNFG